MKFSAKNRIAAASVWIILLIMLSGFSFIKIRNGFDIETNILKMLPFDSEKRVLHEASDRFSEKLSRQVLFIVSHKERDSALSAASILKQDLILLCYYENTCSS